MDILRAKLLRFQGGETEVQRGGREGGCTQLQISLLLLLVMIMVINHLFWALGVFPFNKSFLIGQIPSKTTEEARKRLECPVSWPREEKLKDVEQLAHSSIKGCCGVQQQIWAVFPSLSRYPSCKIHHPLERRDLSLPAFKSQLSHAQRLKQLTVPIQASVIPSVIWGLHSPSVVQASPTGMRTALEKGYGPAWKWSSEREVPMLEL